MLPLPIVNTYSGWTVTPKFPCPLSLKPRKCDRIIMLKI